MAGKKCPKCKKAIDDTLESTHECDSLHKDEDIQDDLSTSKGDSLEPDTEPVDPKDLH